jgi:hypothetical protein
LLAIFPGTFSLLWEKQSTTGQCRRQTEMAPWLPAYWACLDTHACTCTHMHLHVHLTCTYMRAKTKSGSLCRLSSAFVCSETTGTFTIGRQSSACAPLIPRCPSLLFVF